MRKTCLLVALAAAIAWTTPAVAQKKTVLKFAIFTPSKEMTFLKVMRPFAQRVMADSQGTLEIKLFPNGGLGRHPAKQLKMVQDGVADIAWVIPAYTPGRFVDNAVFELPNIIQTSTEGSVAAWRMLQKGMLRGYGGFHMIALFTSGPYTFHTNFKVTKPGDLLGKKIRAVGPNMVASVKAIGAWSLLAAGTVGGHIVECGAQCTGGNFSRWWEVEGWDHLGYPVLEFSADGRFVVTKHDGTGGLVSVDTVGEQLVYEMGDPRNYITPDCVVDFTSIRLEQEARDRVAVSGVRGGPATDTYKVSISYLEGYKAVGQLTVSGPDALVKARICADALWGRLRRAGFDFDDTLTEFVGANACHGAITGPADRVTEVVLRVGVKDQDRAKVDRFGKELAPLVTAGPPGVTGFAGGRPKATEVLGFWPALIAKDRVHPEVDVEEVR